MLDLPPRTRKRLRWSVIAAVVVGFAIHAGLPALAGLGRSLRLIQDGDPWWIAAAVACAVGSFACYIALFRYVVVRDLRGFGWSGSYELGMASLGASTIVTAAGAGGVGLSYLTLTRSGLDRAGAAARIVAFLAFQYAVFAASVIVAGFGLWSGIFSGGGATGFALIPALLALAAVSLAALAARSPERAEQRIHAQAAGRGRAARVAGRILRAPSILAAGLHDAATLMHPRSRGWLLVGLATGYWAWNIGILECCFLAFGRQPAIGGLVLAFFIGSTANLLPLLPGGVGSVEAGLIGALLAVGEPGTQVVVAVLSYRLIGYWLPTVPEAVAYLRLRRTMAAMTPPTVPPRTGLSSLDLGASAVDRARRG